MQNGLLVAEYVTPIMADQLKNENIQFLDTCGNAYLNTSPVYVFVKGNKKQNNNNVSSYKSRAFSKTGLKIIYALLCNLSLVSKPQRILAKRAEVSLGAVSIGYKSLREISFISAKKGGRRLTNKKQLLQRWITAYAEVLRPKLLLGHFSTRDKGWWQEAKLPDGCYWGGEVAASYITGYLKPAQITLYVPELPTLLMLDNRLHKNNQGEVEILKTFWPGDQKQLPERIPHPVLVYADLIASGEDRNLETANLIYEKFLHEHFQ